jgi:uncharacterized protein (TIGR03067 family)
MNMLLEGHMKNTISFMVCLAVTAIVSLGWTREGSDVREADVQKQLIGSWQGVSGHWGKENPPPEARSFTFTTNRQVTFTIGKQTFSGTYRMDISKKPYHIDFTFSHKGKKVTTQTIFDFPKKDHIRIAEWDPNWRRKEFNPGITFKKQTSNRVAKD